MKRILALALCALMIVSMFAGCASKTTDTANKETTQTTSTSDLDYIKDKGTLVVGITDFEPMDYKDESGNWTGFDAEMAKKFAEYLGVNVDFVEIDWDNKVLELNGKKIDCVWNGMTLTDEVKSAMDCSNAYCNNAQVVIVKKDVADKYQKKEDCMDLNFAVESGSAGMEMAQECGFKYTEVKDQATALMEVMSGTCDAAIIDSLMAAAMVGAGTAYADLVYTASLNSEEYGVGFRKDSDLVTKLNEFLSTCAVDGTLEKVATEFGVQAALIK